MSSEGELLVWSGRGRQPTVYLGSGLSFLAQYGASLLTARY